MIGAIDSMGALLERRPVAVVSTLLVCASLSLALLWPHTGEGVLRMLVISLACGYVAVRGYRALPPPLDDRHSPFSRHPLVEQPTGSTMRLRRLEVLFQSSTRAGEMQPTIPGPVRLLIREEAERRLRDRARLDLNDPADHERIQALVRPVSWRAICPPRRLGPQAGGGGDHGGASPPAAPGTSGAITAAVESAVIPLHQLETILDDLERL